VSTLDNLRKSARRWLKSIRAGDAAARARLLRAHPQANTPVGLRDVQHALARERGFESWLALTRASARDGARHAITVHAILEAAAKGDAAAVAAILDRDPDVIDERGTLPGHTGLRTALHFGVRHEAVVRTLLARGADPNIRDEGDHAYPLHFAAERGDLAVVTLLVEHGADPVGAGTTHGLDAVGWAVCFEYANHVDVARYLLNHGATHTLLSAVAMGEADAIRALAAAGADVNQRMDRTNHQRTPLHLAVVKRQPAALAALIAVGADLDLEDAAGLTPLDQATLLDAADMTRMLLEAGARVSLPAAIVLGRTEEIERQVREDPNLLSATDNRRWARLLVQASARAPGPVIETLLRTVMRHRAGLSIVNMEDDEETAVDGARGYTPLHAAAFHGNDAAVEVLLRSGASPRVRDSKYCATPAGWAAYAGHDGTARRILEADIDIFDAVAFDRADRIAEILERDPGAIDRPFNAYAQCDAREGQWWPEPECTPIEWARRQQKTQAAALLTARGAGTRSKDDQDRTTRLVSFLQSACWDEHVHGKATHRMHDRAAQRLLREDPSIARDNVYAAIVCGEREVVARTLTDRPETARARGGPRGWTPLLYLAYTRFTYEPVLENALDIARHLLDHGADPNDFYMAGDARYSVLTGVAGEGEQDAPRQPYARALFELLLLRGAEPFDIQVLYDTHFSGDMLWWLELVHTHTIDTARGAVWRDPEWSMFDMGAYGSGARFVLETALKTRQAALLEWALAHGANPNAAPARDRRFPQRSLYEFAQMEGLTDMAESLARHGAVRARPSLQGRERLLDACLRLDRREVERLLAEDPASQQDHTLLFEAARRDRADVLALLVELGFSIELQDQTGKRALHEAAAHNAVRAIAWLIARGAEVDPRESSYNGTPLGWASHGDHQDAMAVLSRDSRDIWTLCFRGYVDRVRTILGEEPALARIIGREGRTLLWWLPDDEGVAAEMLELLLATGADPAARSVDGGTAADWARRRGMGAIAERLEEVQ
jgi:ankyrin repeat protein